MIKHPLDLPSTSASLVEILCFRAFHYPDRCACIFLTDGEKKETLLTYGDLDQRAKSLAASLQDANMTGECALILHNPGIEYITAFIGCLYAGVTAVPVNVPTNHRGWSRLQSILRDAQATIILTNSDIYSEIQTQQEGLYELKHTPWIRNSFNDQNNSKSWKDPAINPSSLAFLQYTSGSTSSPKGVMVNHSNLLHNLSILYQCFEHTTDSKMVCWLPPYHDLGLIFGILQPFYGGFPVILMSPSAFVEKPIRWLQAISRYQATTSGAPNFGYDLCLSKITPEEREGLDLSSWDLALNAAEPVRPGTLENFASQFAPYGFHKEAFYPCYGLAEATLLVSGGRKKDLPITSTISKMLLENNRIAVLAQQGEERQTFIGCGRTVGSQEIVIVDPVSLNTYPDRNIGEIWVSGKSITQGYWQHPEETQHIFNAYLAADNKGPFLRTGDLGFLDYGELYVTGRIKDLIIIRGRNLYPQDIEFTVERSHSLLRLGCGAAFSIDQDNEEKLVIVQETKPTFYEELLDEVAGAIRQAAVEEHDIQIYAIVFIKQRTIPKTSSGKIQRQACKARFLTQRLDIVGISVLEEPSLESKSGLSREIILKADIDERRSMIEYYLREQIAKVLKINPFRINLQQSLSFLGLDSLRAVELKNDIETGLGVILPLSYFPLAPSITKIVEEILIQLSNINLSLSVELISIQDSSAEQHLSFGQRALWFLYQLAPTSAAYNIVYTAQINSVLKPSALQHSFQKLIDRHASLRTTFLSSNGEPLQQIHEHMKVCFFEIDASSWNEGSLHTHLVEKAHTPFDLEQGPLLKVYLFKTAGQGYILLLTIHHIVADYRSISIILQDLEILYAEEMLKKHTPLPPLEIQYTDYVRWQAQILASPEGEKLWNYWQKQLSGVSTELHLPLDHPRPLVQTYNGSTHQFVINKDLARQVKNFARTEGATLYMALLAVFQVLLYRYTNQPNILVGSPIIGRSRNKLMNLVGYFVNPVVISAHLSTSQTFTTLLEQTRQTVLAALEHQDYPFALLVERLQKERCPNISPIFQVMFDLQQENFVHSRNNSGEIPSQIGGTSISADNLLFESFNLEQQIAQFDLALTMEEREEELIGWLQYNTDLFEQVTIEQIAVRFHVLLEGIILQPDRPLFLLPFLTKAEQQKLLVKWNATQKAYPNEICFHELFEDRAKLTPSALAVICEKQELTYRDLNYRANQFATYLRHIGVRSEVLVGVYLERSLDMMVALLGILKAGGAYVPLDSTYPKERISFILHDAQISVLLTQQSLAQDIPSHDAKMILLDTDWGNLPLDDLNTGFWTKVNPANVAYVIYTSGSTGEPKGTQISHQSVVNYTLAISQAFRLQPHDRVLQFAPISFDVSIEELFPTWLAGATVVLNTSSILADCSSFLRTIEQEKISVFEVPAVYWNELLNELDRLNQHWPLSLRLAIVGSEVVSLAHLTTWQRRICSYISLINVYGLTETTITSTLYEANLKTENFDIRSKLPIGRPITNTQIYLLDDNFMPVPTTLPGEIYIGGVGVGRGYLNRPDLTAERFVPDPFSTEAGSRLYRTGDLARYHADGNIEFLGRIDDQIKLRGIRIELGEVEVTLRRHPTIKDVVVSVRGDTPEEKQLVAYVVSDHSLTQDLLKEVRQHLRSYLPEYMIPSVFVSLESLPLSPNGKVNRHALPAPETLLPLKERSYKAPGTLIEETLAQIWSELLRREQVSIYDDFFELGGHSLLATRLVSRIHTAFQVKIPLLALFEAPTIAHLATYIEQRYQTEVSHLPSILPISRDQLLPLSFAQSRLWFLEQLMSATPVYNIPNIFYLRGTLQIEILQQSFNELLSRHEILRTTFAMVDEIAVQVVAPTSTLMLSVKDLTLYPPDHRQAERERLIAQEALRPFDLSCDFPVRVTLLRLQSDEYILLLTMHHIAFDGWSAAIFMQELSTLYEAYIAGKPSPLPNLPIQYADFAFWQRQWLQGGVMDAQLTYWKQQLAGAPAILQLPTDRPRPAVQTFRGAWQSLELSQSLTTQLKHFSQQEGVTLFMTLLTAFKILLCRYTGQVDIIVGTPIANRSHHELEALIGFFVNTLVLRTDLSGNPSFRTLLKRVRQVTLEAYEHQDVPFEKLVEELHPERNLSYQPLFQVVFALQNLPPATLILPGLTVETLEVAASVAKFDLTMSVVDSNRTLVISVEYSTDLFNTETIQRLLNHFRTLLEGIAANQEQEILRLPLVSKKEIHQLEKWSAQGN